MTSREELQSKLLEWFHRLSPRHTSSSLPSKIVPKSSRYNLRRASSRSSLDRQFIIGSDNTPKVNSKTGSSLDRTSEHERRIAKILDGTNSEDSNDELEIARILDAMMIQEQEEFEETKLCRNGSGNTWIMSSFSDSSDSGCSDDSESSQSSSNTTLAETYPHLIIPDLCVQEEDDARDPLVSSACKLKQKPLRKKTKNQKDDKPRQRKGDHSSSRENQKTGIPRKTRHPRTQLTENLDCPPAPTPTASAPKQNRPCLRNAGSDWRVGVLPTTTLPNYPQLSLSQSSSRCYESAHSSTEKYIFSG